ncbi:hypothetical protein A0128_05675 [Leptospira tipperaryensis]|uniref:Uncharacterized protein n=1 Tax=Leptospira tipperaryensis TaxID=2564040 RepID=A0A1D7UUZ9_9LEPT|nr:hypothetical protein A0128_05675 [Leptospira tipperaryensis]
MFFHSEIGVEESLIFLFPLIRSKKKNSHSILLTSPYLNSTFYFFRIPFGNKIQNEERFFFECDSNETSSYQNPRLLFIVEWI